MVSQLIFNLAHIAEITLIQILDKLYFMCDFDDDIVRAE